MDSRTWIPHPQPDHSSAAIALLRNHRDIHFQLYISFALLSFCILFFPISQLIWTSHSLLCGLQGDHPHFHFGMLNLPLGDPKPSFHSSDSPSPFRSRERFPLKGTLTSPLPTYLSLGLHVSWMCRSSIFSLIFMSAYSMNY